MLQITNATGARYNRIDVSGAILTLNDSTSISGGTLTVESTTGSELQITAGTGADGATPGGVTLDGVIVTDNNATDGIDFEDVWRDPDAGRRHGDQRRHADDRPWRRASNN